MPLPRRKAAAEEISATVPKHRRRPRDMKTAVEAIFVGKARQYNRRLSMAARIRAYPGASDLTV